MAAMLEDMLDKKVIELPDCKRPYEMNRVNDLKYCRYHRIVSHPVGKCFVLKELIMKLALEGRIELDLEEAATVNTTTIVFGSFDHVHFYASPINPQLHSSKVCREMVIAREVNTSKEVRNHNLYADDNEGWTLVTQRKVQKLQPQVTHPMKEEQRKSHRHHTDRTPPKVTMKVTKSTFREKPKSRKP